MQRSWRWSVLTFLICTGLEEIYLVWCKNKHTQAWVGVQIQTGMNYQVLWDVMPCQLVNSERHFWGTTLYSYGSQHWVTSHHQDQNLKHHTNILKDRINLLFSLMSRLLIHRMPGMHDSSTCAPWAPRLLQLMSSSISMVDSLQANPSSRFLSTTQCPPCISYWAQHNVHPVLVTCQNHNVTLNLSRHSWQ